MIQRLRSRRGMFGNILQPDECWMLDGRLPTVALRMNRQSKNAQRVAEALVGHKRLNQCDLPDAVRPTRSRNASTRSNAPTPAGSSRSISRAAKRPPSIFCAA